MAALEYSCWADVTDSGEAPGGGGNGGRAVMVRDPQLLQRWHPDRRLTPPSPPARPPPPPPTPTRAHTDHKPVYAVLEVNLPITDQARKRGICSNLLKDCSAAVLQGVQQAAAACSLAPQRVQLSSSALPRQMVLLSNADAHAAVLFAVRPVQGLHGGAGSAAGAVQQRIEVRPVKGLVPPGGEQQVQLHFAAAAAAADDDEWSVPRGGGGAAGPTEVTFEVSVGSEYCVGGEATAPGSATHSLTATCLSH